MKSAIATLFVLVLLATLSAAQSGEADWEILEDWGELPDGVEWEQTSQISTTPSGQLIVLRRTNPAFFVFEPDGTLVKSWGEDLFRLAHGVRVDREGYIWVTDNTDNFVQKFSQDGEILMTLGQRGVTGDNSSRDAFDGPADVFVTPDGDIYVADGYRNSRIVHFSADGEFVRIIGGTQGSGPGEFNVPHAVVVDSRGRIIVADAENSRVQAFSPSGEYLEEWTDFPSKPRGSMYITEDDTLYISHVDAEAVTIMRNGEVIDLIEGIGARPHGVTLDHDGNVYVANSANRIVKKIIRK